MNKEELNVAHVFQEKYTGVQIFVYHVKDSYYAFEKLRSLVIIEENWIYLGEKVADYVQNIE